MAIKSWSWKNPNLQTGEKGVIMFLRIHSYSKWKMKVVGSRLKIAKKYYNFIMGEHLQISNPMYKGLFKNYYRDNIRDFDLWFYGLEDSKKAVYKLSMGNAKSVDHIKMPASCYLTDEDFWTTDKTEPKIYDFVVCYNWIMKLKRPSWPINLFEQWKMKFPQAKMAFIYGNIVHEQLWKDVRAMAKGIDGIEWIKDPEPKQIRKIYRQSRFILHSSKSESGPRVIGEAMGCGCKAIVCASDWFESIEHLRHATIILNKTEWNSMGGVNKILEFDEATSHVVPGSLLNTKYYIDVIDKRLASLNKQWTLGQLKVPTWIGEKRSIQTDGDKLFYKLVGVPLT